MVVANIRWTSLLKSANATVELLTLHMPSTALLKTQISQCLSNAPLSALSAINTQEIVRNAKMASRLLMEIAWSALRMLAVIHAKMASFGIQVSVQIALQVVRLVQMEVAVLHAKQDLDWIKTKDVCRLIVIPPATLAWMLQTTLICANLASGASI